MSSSGVGNGYISTVQVFKPSHQWEKQVRQSCLPSGAKEENALVVLVTGAAGFVGTHVSLALKKRGDGVVGLDNFNTYYEISLKRARQDMLAKHGVFVVEGDINDKVLLESLFDLVGFTHVMHLAAQAGVRYAMQNPGSYIHSNIAGLVNIFEVCKAANPQPSIVWASSSSVYGLNTKVCHFTPVYYSCGTEDFQITHCHSSVNRCCRYHRAIGIRNVFDCVPQDFL
jgi:UDP-glucuronate 4-epimerase